MILFLVQTAILLAAGLALWRLWRFTDRHSSRIGLLVAGALLLRAIPGVVLFWISYLELPYGRSLQLTKGFWFYATDGLAYFNRAIVAASDGVPGIILMARHSPSVVYNQVLALFLWLLGPIPAIGVLLNAFAFLGIAALVVTWARRYGIGFFGTALPIVAAGYSPSWVLWSTQPLKDAFFCFVIVLFAYAVDLWVRAWRESERRPQRIIGAALLLAISIYAVAGVRWYYAVVALGAVLLPFALAVWTTRRRALALVATAVTIVVLAQQIVFASGPYLPESIRHLLRLRPKLAAQKINETIEGSRRSFDSYVASGTRIRAGEKLARAETPKPKRTQSPISSGSNRPVTTTTVAPAPAPVTTTTVAPAPAPVATTTVAPAPAPVTTTTVVPAPAPVTTTTVAPAPAPVATTTVAPRKTPAAVPRPEARTERDVPSIWSTRLIAGVTALLLPHFVGEGLGIVSLGEGRGFWWFADVDTILFNVFVCASLAALFVRRKTVWRDPLTWYLVAVTVAIAVALAYTVSNYGALFRHRSMILAVIVLLPIAAYRSRPRAAATEPVDEEMNRDRISSSADVVTEPQ